MDRATLESMIATGRDSAMLRLALAKLLMNEGQLDSAAIHLEAAVAQDAGYTAAWKELGRARLAQGKSDQAERAWQRGIAVARDRGDKQAEREMNVFLKRLRKSRGGPGQ